MREALKVSVSGVRGVVGESLTPQVAASFAQAFGTFVGHGPVIVSRDTRPTGPMIEAAVISGLQSVGCKPLLAGVLPTPTALFLTRQLGARGGVAITASHNPSEWNALKFVDRTGIFLNETRAEELFDIYHQQEFPLVEGAEIPVPGSVGSPTSAHFQKVIGYVDAEAIRARKLRVAVDCCNGVGAIYSSPFLRELGCEVFPLFDRPTGDFERDPEPLPQHLSRLCELVRAERCDVGFAQDPDGDRLAIVDESGTPIGEDLTLVLGVQQVLARHRQGPVVVNLASSKAVEWAAREHRSRVIRTRTGEINVAETMLMNGGVVGGENNGGLIIPDIHPCRDSFAAMAIVLELLAGAEKSVSAVRAAIPTYHLVKDKIPLRAEQAPMVLRYIRRAYEGQKVNLLDGVYVDFGDSWVHTRRSNTEPVLRVLAEAPSREQAERLAEELRGHIEAAVI